MQRKDELASRLVAIAIQDIKHIKTNRESPVSSRHRLFITYYGTLVSRTRLVLNNYPRIPLFVHLPSALGETTW